MYRPESRLEASMVAKYDIFRKTNDSVVWVEAVEDIVTAKKRLISLASVGTDNYRIWDSSRQQFIDLLDDCA
jgi:predicted amidohydrolase